MRLCSSLSAKIFFAHVLVFPLTIHAHGCVPRLARPTGTEPPPSSSAPVSGFPRFAPLFSPICAAIFHFLPQAVNIGLLCRNIAARGLCLRLRFADTVVKRRNVLTRRRQGQCSSHSPQQQAQHAPARAQSAYFPPAQPRSGRPQSTIHPLSSG